MLYEYVFYAGLVNQRFRIFSGPARRPIPCNHSKLSEINLSPFTFVVEYEEGDILEYLQVTQFHNEKPLKCEAQKERVCLFTRRVHKNHPLTFLWEKDLTC